MTQIIAARDANIRALSTVRIASDITELLIEVEVWDLKHLNQLLMQLQEAPCVSMVARVYE
jgi:guanosine-3',5'-bis(diphosphate) 3'-pyrophosphohydrolase